MAKLQKGKWIGLCQCHLILLPRTVSSQTQAHTTSSSCNTGLRHHSSLECSSSEGRWCYKGHQPPQIVEPPQAEKETVLLTQEHGCGYEEIMRIPMQQKNIWRRTCTTAACADSHIFEMLTLRMCKVLLSTDSLLCWTTCLFFMMVSFPSFFQAYTAAMWNPSRQLETYPTKYNKSPIWMLHDLV